MGDEDSAKAQSHAAARVDGADRVAAIDTAGAKGWAEAESEKSPKVKSSTTNILWGTDLEQNDELGDGDALSVKSSLAETSDLAFSENQQGVYDDAEEISDQVQEISYDITSYGADFPADMLVARLRQGDIVIPKFQRDFVWTQRDASRFIESLILGLPVPGIFLSKDQENRLVVVDGQQRLRSIRAYFENDFKGRSFPLTKVHKMLESRRYKELEPEQRRNLDNAVLHATIFTQNLPQDDGSATYSVFERLNTGGRRLYPQEIRAAIYHRGGFSDTLKEFNDVAAWRSIFGRNKSERMKDVELILRFLALFESSDSYEKPMKAFLNSYMARHAVIDEVTRDKMRHLFSSTITYVYESLGQRAFKPLTAFNAAVFDAVMVGIARRLSSGSRPPSDEFRNAYEQLLKKPEFRRAYLTATSNDESVAQRLTLATQAFESI